MKVRKKSERMASGKISIIPTMPMMSCMKNPFKGGTKTVTAGFGMIRKGAGVFLRMKF